MGVFGIALLKSWKTGLEMVIFTFTINKDFDYTSPQNIERLQKEARYLMEQVLLHWHLQFWEKMSDRIR
jgi:hypothetical protein